MRARASQIPRLGCCMSEWWGGAVSTAGTMGRRIDPGSFHSVFQDNYQFVCRLVLGITGSLPAAEDVAQETFVRLYRTPPADLGNVRGWLGKVAVNLALNHLRSEQLRQRRGERHPERRGEGRGDTSEGHDMDWLYSKAVLDGDVVAASPEEEVVRREDEALMRSILAALPDRDRAILLLRASGMSYREIGEALRIKETSVGTLLARARQAFASLYARREVREE